MPDTLKSRKHTKTNTVALIGMDPQFLADFPELSILALQAIASWSNVEATMQSMFTNMLGGNKAMATAIYLAMKSSDQKTAAILAASKVLFTEDSREMEVLLSIIAISKTNQGRRDKLAHWQWGPSSNSDELALSNPKSDSFEEVEIYKKADFEAMIKDNIRLRNFIMQFRTSVCPFDGCPKDPQVFEDVFTAPEIQEKIRYRAAKQSRPV